MSAELLRSTMVVLASVLLAASCQPEQDKGAPTVQPSGGPTAGAPLVRASPSATSTATETNPTAVATVEPSPLPLEQLASLTLWSPDASLVARLYSDYDHPSGFQTIEISSPDGALLRSIPYKDQPRMGDPRPNLAIAGWSPDSGSLFFYYSFFYDGGPTLWSGFNLRGINIASGRIATLIPSDGIMAFRFSPDFTRLAYILDEDDPRILYIRTLASGEVRNFKTNVPRYDGDIYSQMGSIRWSDSGNRLIVFTGTTEERSAMFLFDILHSSGKRLLAFWLEQYEIEDWSSDDTLRLHNLFDGWIETMNLKTGQLTVLGTPTPNP